MADGAAAAAIVVVVFGGTGFMGRELVRRIETGSDATEARTTGSVLGVVQLNRGTGYWGDARRTRATSGELFTAPSGALSSWVRLDFDGPSSDSDDDDAAQETAATALHRALAGMRQRLPEEDRQSRLRVVVVAFSLDCADHASASVEIVSNAIEGIGTWRQYVLISSDSAYDPRKVAAASSSSTATIVENDAWLYDDDPRPDRRYGVCKAAIEHRLRSVLPSRGGVPLLTLRLPDVFGPYDNTGRWWATQIWGAAEPKRCYYPASLGDRVVSVVFSGDVVRCVMRAVAGSATDRVAQGAYHLASPPVRLIDFVATALRAGSPDAAPAVVAPSACSGSDDDSSAATSDDGEDACDFYPSVEVPPLDVGAAARDLGFAATPLHEAAAATGAFFRSPLVLRDGGRRHRQAVAKLPRWVRIAARRQNALAERP